MSDLILSTQSTIQTAPMISYKQEQYRYREEWVPTNTYTTWIESIVWTLLCSILVIIENYLFITKIKSTPI